MLLHIWLVLFPTTCQTPVSLLRPRMVIPLPSKTALTKFNVLLFIPGTPQMVLHVARSQMTANDSHMTPGLCEGC